MEAGKLRHRIVIQQPVESEPTATGQRDVTWVKFDKAWAEITSTPGNEGLDVRTINAQMSHRVRIRYRAGLQTTFRVLWGTRLLSLNSIVDVDNRRREQFLYCSEDLS